MSDKAKRIRQYAKINGGVETVVAEKGDTLLFDHEGSFRQYFSNGAVLEFDKKTGNATIFFKGKEMVSADNVLVREMPSLQIMAARWRQKDAEIIGNPGMRERLERGFRVGG